MRPLLAVFLVAAISCTKTEQVRVHRSEIYRHIPELREAGFAKVETHKGKHYQLEASRVFHGVPSAGGYKSLSVAQLIDGCPDVAPFADDPYQRKPPCALLAGSASYLLKEEEVYSRQRTRGAVLLLGLTGATLGTGYCAFECDRGPVQVASVVGLVLFGGSALLTALAVLDRH